MSKKNISLLITIVVAVYYAFTTTSSQTSPILGVKTVALRPTITLLPVQQDTFMVSKVVDGDTIKVTKNEATYTVRLIGVDTPETVDPRKTVQCFGKEASAFTKGLIEGKEVTLTTDPTQDLTDKYKRWLRYVHLADGTFVNQQIIAEGYGYEYTYAVAYTYQQAFKDAQADAQKNSKGLWNSSTCSGKR